MNEAVRFQTPMKFSRPKGDHMIIGYSPKLGRRLRLYAHDLFELWLTVEADPDIEIFCERPVVMQYDGRERAIDFWIRRADREEFLLLDEETDDWPGQWMGIEINRVGLAELASHRVWASNWQQMLPVITMTRDCITRQYLEEIRRFIKTPTPLNHIEREFSTVDPLLVRGALFRLLAAGRLTAPSLKHETLSFLTQFEPTQDE